jgi:hypothetical protein
VERELWWLCKWGLDNDHEKPEHKTGARRIAHAMNEALVARSLYHGDWKQINELAAVTQAVRKTRNHEGPKCIEVVLRIFTWHGHLAAKLGRPPSREELKSFILDLGDGISSRKETWCDAFNFLLLEYASPRSIRRDEMEITRLARLARKTGNQKPKSSPPAKLLEPEWVALARRD